MSSGGKWGVLVASGVSSGGNLGWNRLEELPASFGQLVWLRELHLRGNRIAALPDGFEFLLRLEVLETEGNYPKLTVLQVPPRLSRVTF